MLPIVCLCCLLCVHILITSLLVVTWNCNPVVDAHLTLVNDLLVDDILLSEQSTIVDELLTSQLGNQLQANLKYTFSETICTPEKPIQYTAMPNVVITLNGNQHDTTYEMYVEPRSCPLRPNHERRRTTTHV